MSRKISVITICRNNYEGLIRTYRSLGMQDSALFEWIVVDGVSTDATLAFLSSLRREFVNWVSEPDEGIYDAMNKGIQRSKGLYCVFMNAGDEFGDVDTLSTVSSSLDGINDIVYGDAIEVFPYGESYKRAFLSHRYWYSMFTHHQAIYYRREIIVSGYDLSFRLAADWVLTSRLLMDGAKANYLPFALCRFQRGGSSDVRQLRTTANRELWRVYKEVHRRSLVVACVLYAAKRVGNVVRFSCAPVYNRIRMTSVPGASKRRTELSAFSNAKPLLFLHFPYYNGSNSSMGAYADELYSVLSEFGFDVRFCCIMRFDKFPNGINVSRNFRAGWGRYLKMACLYAKMHAYVFVLKPALIINLSQEFIFPGYLNRSMNIIYDTIQSRFPRSKAIFYYMKIMWFLARRSRANVTISASTRKDLESMGINSFVVYSHFDIDKMSEYKALGITKHYDAIWCGSGLKHKNVELFLTLARAFPKRSFCIIVPSHDRKSLSVTKNVEVFSNLSPKDYYSLFLQSRLFISTSLAEGYGRPPMEALILGVPILVSDIPVFREIYGSSAEFHDLTSNGIVEKFGTIVSIFDEGGKIDIDDGCVYKMIEPVSNFIPVIKSIIDSSNS